MHLGERRVVDIARVDARAETAHEPLVRGLAEDGRSDGVDAHELDVGQELPQSAADPRGVAPGADGADEDVDVPELGEQFERERLVGADVVRVGVLIRAPGRRIGGQEGLDAVPAGLLPPTARVRFGDHLHPGAVRGEHLGQDRFQSRVGHQRHGMIVHDPRQRQPEAQGAAG